MTLLLKSDREVIERYENEHAHCWPEVEAGLERIGIINMFIFRKGRRLFMYYEAKPDFDPGRDFALAMEDPAYRRWEELMNSLQERAPEAEPHEWWAEMSLIFHLHADHEVTADE